MSFTHYVFIFSHLSFYELVLEVTFRQFETSKVIKLPAGTRKIIIGVKVQNSLFVFTFLTSIIYDNNTLIIDLILY